MMTHVGKVKDISWSTTPAKGRKVSIWTFCTIPGTANGNQRQRQLRRAIQSKLIIFRNWRARLVSEDGTAGRRCSRSRSN